MINLPTFVNISPIIIIIIIHFENVHFFLAKLGLYVCPHEVPPHIPVYCPFRLRTKHFHVILHIFIPSLPIFLPYISPLPPLHFYRPIPNHPHSYTPDVQTTFATSHHICHTLYTQKTVQIHTALSILQRHSTHPSHHHPLHPLQTADLQPPFQSHMSTHSGHNFIIHQPDHLSHPHTQDRNIYWETCFLLCHAETLELATSYCSHNNIYVISDLSALNWNLTFSNLHF